MNKREIRAYKKGQADIVKTMLSLLFCTGIFIAAVVKAGIFVM